ncbi:MAG: GDP-mannose 4,6-dehydratase [Planctomycetaceae bacterium]|nr:GDP-mannose 4,6-dehydratase [Planctomycetaceae bacterium]
MKRAFVTGITGQDGYYLTRLLLEKGYDVQGIVRRTSSMTRRRIDQLKDEMPECADRITMQYGDVTDAAGLIRVVMELEPDEIYNLAAQSHVRVSFDKPAYTQSANADGCLNLLEAVRLLNQRKPVRFYQASTSEMFGGLPETVPQSEQTRFHPRSPYATAKVAAFHHTVNYREAYGLFACNGILFNHESPLRGENFVTRKITLAAARIKEGLQSELSLGNLDALRDWGYAADYVEAMWMMMQQDDPDDFVIATGVSHSVREFLEEAFSRVGLDYQDYLRIDQKYFRPTEVEQLCGDPSKARDVLGWEPKTDFYQLVQLMVDHDCEVAKHERLYEDIRGQVEARETWR